MADVQQTCPTCRYFESEHRVVVGSLYHGSCKRYPPFWHTNGSQSRSCFVPVRSTDGCGEHCPANPKTVSEGAAYLARLVVLGDMTAAYALIDKLQEERPPEESP